MPQSGCGHKPYRNACAADQHRLDCGQTVMRRAEAPPTRSRASSIAFGQNR
jgi:hypothetical protein